MSGRAPPPKPWERRGGATSTAPATPLGPSSPNDGAPKPWEQQQAAGTAAQTLQAMQQVSQVPAPRPWQNPASTTALGVRPGYGSGYSAVPYNRGGYGGTPSYGGGYTGGYGSTAYGSGPAYGRPGGMYGTGYGATGYGTTGYGNTGYGQGGYGTSYNGGYNYGMGSYGGMQPYGVGQYGAPAGGAYPGDPNAPPVPPTGWQHMLAAIGGVVHFFGRLSFLVDENAHAVHFFVQALLQLLDRFGSLYGELARWVLHLLGYRRKDVPAAKGDSRAIVPVRSGSPHPASRPGVPGHSGQGLDNFWPAGR